MFIACFKLWLFTSNGTRFIHQFVFKSLFHSLSFATFFFRLSVRCSAAFFLSIATLLLLRSYCINVLENVSYCDKMRHSNSHTVSTLLCVITMSFVFNMKSSVFFRRLQLLHTHTHTQRTIYESKYLQNAVPIRISRNLLWNNKKWNNLMLHPWSIPISSNGKRKTEYRNGPVKATNVCESQKHTFECVRCCVWK